MKSWAANYKLKDFQTDIGIKTFTDIAQNIVYTGRKDLESTLMGLNLSNLTNLDALTGQLKGILGDILNMPVQMFNEIKASIERVVDSLMNMPFVGFVKDLLNDLKSLDEEGMKHYLTRELQAGNWILCNNLDVLQGLMDGIKFDPAILDGFFMSMSLGWLNRQCKDITPEQEDLMTNRQIIEANHPYKGVEVDNVDLVNVFMRNSAGYLQDHTDIGHYVVNEAEILKNAVEGTFNNYIDSISHNVYKGARESIRGVLDKALFSRSSNDRSRLEYARGMTADIPTYGTDIIKSKNNAPRSKDALGSVLKKLSEIDLTAVPKHSLNETELSIRDKLFMVKAMTSTTDFLSRSHAQMQFYNYDFEEIMDIFTEEEKQYMLGMERSTDSYRYNNLNVTTEAFVEDTVPRPRKRPIVKPSDPEGRQPKTKPDFAGSYTS